MMDYMFEARPRYLVVDEIEHMPMRDQTALWSLDGNWDYCRNEISKDSQDSCSRRGFMLRVMELNGC